jgi:hypothetical protein
MPNLDLSLHPWLFPAGDDLAALLNAAWRHHEPGDVARLARLLERQDLEKLARWVKERSPVLKPMYCNNRRALTGGSFRQPNEEGRLEAIAVPDTEGLARAVREFALVPQDERLVWQVTACGSMDMELSLWAGGPWHCPTLRLACNFIAASPHPRIWRGVYPLSVDRLRGERRRPARALAMLAADLASQMGEDPFCAVEVPVPAGAPRDAVQALAAALRKDVDDGLELAARAGRRRRGFLVADRLDACGFSEGGLAFRLPTENPVEIDENRLMNAWCAKTWGEFRALAPEHEATALGVHWLLKHGEDYETWACGRAGKEVDAWREWQAIAMGYKDSEFEFDRTPPGDADPFTINGEDEWVVYFPRPYDRALDALPPRVADAHAASQAARYGMMSICGCGGDEVMIDEDSLEDVGKDLNRRNIVLLPGKGLEGWTHG